jgi:DNA (cytosine-5)-methyltransferase 1
MSAPRIGSLCSGYGGLSMATESVLGGSLAWVSDIDKGACKVLAHRFPGVPNIGDMTTVDWSQVEPVDVLEGGTPCQDLSHAGKRKGMSEGTRSNLWVTMREAIAVMRPSLVIWENVGGAYSAAADSEMEPDAGLLGDGPGRPALRALGRVLGDLASLGYDAEWHGIRAADVGAPHGRLRVFLVAYPQGDSGRFVNGDGGVTAHTDLPGREARRGRQGAGNARRLEPVVSGSAPLLPTPRTSDTNGAGQHGQGGVDLRTAVSLLPTPTTQDGAKDHEVRREPHRPDATDTLSRALTRFGDYAAAVARWEAVLRRPAPDPTTTSKKGTPQLNAEFASWMMGLPAGWITDVPTMSRNEALKLAGNGVVPQQAEAALRLMLNRAANGVAA